MFDETSFWAFPAGGLSLQSRRKCRISVPIPNAEAEFMRNVAPSVFSWHALPAVHLPH